MLHIYTNGNHKLLLEAYDYAQEVIKILGIENINIEIIFDELGIDGYCEVSVDDRTAADITINEDMNNIKQFITIAHELIHTWQFINGLDMDEDVAYYLEEELYEIARVYTYE